MPYTLRPAADEYAPYYAGYIATVPDGDLRETLDRTFAEAMQWLRAVPEERGDHRYAPGKWSVKEVIGHVTDAERVFAHRLLRFARADETPLPGFDENAWVPAARFERRTLSALLDEWAAVRQATLALLRTLDEEELARRGTANGQPASVRALAWIIAGHALHHLRLLRERYGLGA